MEYGLERASVRERSQFSLSSKGQYAPLSQIKQILWFHLQGKECCMVATPPDVYWHSLAVITTTEVFYLPSPLGRLSGVLQACFPVPRSCHSNTTPA